MKIAIPVKTNRENPAIAPLFGKAKWFAFVEDGEVSIEKNEAEGGVRVVDWLIKLILVALLTKGKLLEARKLHSITFILLSLAKNWILKGPVILSALASLTVILFILLTVSK